VLVGLPGAGKSTVGRGVAAALSLPYLDVDEEIVRRTGFSVAEIFEQQGEEHFRALEIEVTRAIAAGEPSVIAPGGGWLTNSGVLGLFAIRPLVVHLRVSPLVALARLQADLTLRPLLDTEDPLLALDELLRSRASLYSRADLEVDTDVFDAQQVTATVVRLARQGGLV
jgi:shikimate kinase